jgi:putative FmdB family regulatory protein
MPIYEYRCGRCGVIEVMQRITERSLKRCPKCKSTVERMLSQSSFVLKGSGWYATDYARKDSKAASKPESGSTPTSEGAATTTNGSSTEPAAKPGSTAEKPTAAKTSE